MQKSAKVYYQDFLAGTLSFNGEMYNFAYDPVYLTKNNEPISLTLPLTAMTYSSTKLFSFFEGLMPEGWLLDLNAKILKIDQNNSFEMLLKVGKDCVGAVKVIED
jgi:serine/threonine-protein kinase HipA